MSRFPSVLLILAGLACGVMAAVGAETKPLADAPEVKTPRSSGGNVPPMRREAASETQQPSDAPEAKAPRSNRSYMPSMIVHPPADAFPAARGRDPSAQREMVHEQHAL